MLLKLTDVEKQYKGFSLNCSLELREGCVTGLIGRNGAGKSTTFKAILDLIRMDGGEIEIFGKPKSRLTIQDRAKIGVVLSDSGFNGYLTVKDIIPVVENLYPDFEKKKFLAGCENFRILMDKKIKEFSTGMRAKLKILLAISQGARLLILDEPTAGLDVIARNTLLDMLREFMEQEECGILVSSHISTDLEGLCDDIYMIDNGKVILHEDTDVLLGEYGLLKMTEEQYATLDKSYILKEKKESYGYSCLTGNKQFFLENYPKIIVEKGNIDEIIMMIADAEKEGAGR